MRAAGGGDRFQAFLRLFKLLRLQRVILWYRRKARDPGTLHGGTWAQGSLQLQRDILWYRRMARAPGILASWNVLVVHFRVQTIYVVSK